MPGQAGEVEGDAGVGDEGGAAGAAVGVGDGDAVDVGFGDLGVGAQDVGDFVCAYVLEEGEGGLVWRDGGA